MPLYTIDIKISPRMVKTQMWYIDVNICPSVRRCSLTAEPRCDNLKLCIGQRRTTITLVVPALSARNLLLDKKTSTSVGVVTDYYTLKHSRCCFLAANEE